MQAPAVEAPIDTRSEATGPALSLAPDAPAALADVLRRAAAAAAPGRVVQVARDGRETVLDYQEVRQLAERILGGLRARGVAPGDELLLQVETADEFVPALWACILGGFVAVPAAVAGGDGPGGPAARRLREVWTTLERPTVLTGTGAADSVRSTLGADVRIAPLAELAAHAPDGDWHASAPDAVAVLILSSGTTGRPKLIQRTHHNLLRVCQGSPALDGYTHVTFLNWLPLDHNAGLTGSLAVMAAGAPQVHLATRDVLDRPERWLDAVHRHRVTHTAGTNYALGLVNAALAEGGEHAWDLSCVESLIVTAEPVVARTVRAFVEHASRYGFRPEALRAGYGMSEAGGITRLSPLSLDGDDDNAFVKAGTPYPGISLRVVDADGRVAAEGERGRIQVRGETVTPGYARDPELTRESFTADGWFETGDAGFLRGGALTLTGREKDVLIVNGLNIHSQEVEAAVEEVDGVQRGCTAVCAVRTPGRDTDDAAVFLHTPLTGAAERDALRREVRRVVASRFGAAAARVLLVERGDIPRTDVGKIQRAALRQRLEDGGFAAAVAEDADTGGGEGYVAPRTELEREICGVWSSALGIDRVGVHDDFVGLGGHSLLAGRIAARVRLVTGADVPLRIVFEHPTVAGLAAAVDAWRGEGEPASAGVPADGPPPLSFGQQRLWFLDRLEPGGSAYNLSRALRLRGALHVAALRRALDEIVRRHEPLRTVFSAAEGEPVQVVLPAAAVELPVEDLSILSVDAREAEATRRASEAAAAPFDLARGPLFRAALLRLAADEHVLLLAMHHAVSDGWSIGVLFREMEALYAAFAAGEPSPLPPLPLRYADHAIRQRAELAGEALHRPLEWWRTRLQGAPALLELPTDRPRPAVQSHRGAVLRFALPPELGGRLAAVGRAEGATLFMTVLAAFQVLLARYSGQDDVVVGTPVAGRTRPELEGLIGFFATTLALRTDLSGDPTFGQLLRRVREGTLGAFAHQELPFEQLVEALQPERSRAHSPVFQVALSLQDGVGAPPRLPGIETSPVPGDGCAAMFDLSLHLVEEGRALRGALEYATDLFDAATAERMVGHLRMLLEGAASAPQKRLSELEMLGADERRLVVHEWNRTEAAYPADQCLHQLFEVQAARTPDAVAVAFEGRTMTYAELDARANQLAHRLRRLGVGPEVRAGVCMERGIEMVVSLLAVLKAGGAYVPLDPEYPAERLAYMVADAAVPVLLTQPHLLESLPEHGARTLVVDPELAVVRDEPREAPQQLASPGHLAYAIYTSGSTGRPKGAMNAHVGVVNRLAWMQDEYALSPDDVVLQKTPFSFDVSVWEFFWPLAVGARLVLARPGGHRDAAYLARLIDGERVTTLHFVPSMLAAFLDAVPAGTCGSLLRVVCSGEALPAELAARFYAWMNAGGNGRAGLHNLYGPTEAAVDVTYWPCARGDAAGGVPIGRPVANTQIHVLDRRGAPVPVGIPGELHIGGVQVGRGYLGRPALTAEKFVPDPFSANPGARMYRTGDRVRRRADGALLYLGRIDFQVKLRGLRIELGEIDATLRRHPAVRDCVVLVREDAPGEKRLVAYVAGEAEVDALRAHLRLTLPEYMVPAAFVMMEALPLTPNGKLDRGALPAPEYAAAAECYVAPRTPVEEVLSGIWAQLLGVERVGIHDDFFQRGGHSLLATRLVWRIQEVLEGDVDVVVLFETPTIAGIAPRLSPRQAVAAAPAAGESAHALLETLDELSDEELDRLLAEAVEME